jgi:hypothetical protein
LGVDPQLLEEFERASLAYQQATGGAFNELYRWRDEQHTEPIRRFRGTAFSDLQAASRNLDRQIPAVASLRLAIEAVEQAMHAAYQLLDPLVNQRLDNIDLYWRHSMSLTADSARSNARVQAARPLPRDTLDQLRPTHRTIIESLERTRLSVVEIGETFLRRPASELCSVRNPT